MRRLFLYVAIALCAGLVVACAGMKKSPEDKQKQAFDDFRAKVADVIEDPDREAQAIELVSEMQQDFFDVRAANAKAVTDLRNLNADYDASREDLEAALEQLLTRVRSEHQDVVDSYRQFRKIMTEEEWDAIAKSKSRALSAAVKQIRAE